MPSLDAHARRAAVAVRIHADREVDFTSLADEPDTTVLLTGGQDPARGELSLIGAEAEDFYLRYNSDTYVMGIAGVHGRRRASEYHREEGREEGYVKQAAMRSADRMIVAADASKLGRVQLINVAPVSAISVLVTDGSPRHPTVETLRAAGVDVRCVDAAAQRHLTLTADPDGSATVELVELLGPRAIVTVGVGKHRLTSVVGAAALAAIPVDATVRLSARPSEVHRCSVASGERL